MSDSIYYYAQNKMAGKRWIDIAKPAPEDNRTAEEILDATLLSAGLTLME